MRAIQDAPDKEETALPPDLRFLKGLVTVLTAVMIIGVITIVALLVIRLNAGAETVLITPERFVLPEGVGITGYSLTQGTAVIVSDDGMIRVFEAESGALLQEVPARP